MKVIRGKNGFSIIEALVSIVLLGLLLSLTASFFTSLFDKPELLLKDEALLMAESSMNKSVRQSLFSDSLYYNEKKTLEVSRKVYYDSSFVNILIIVKGAGKNKEIVRLEREIYIWQE